MVDAEKAYNKLNQWVTDHKLAELCAPGASSSTSMSTELRTELQALIWEVVLTSTGSPDGARLKAKCLELWSDALDPNLNQALAKSLAKDVLALPSLSTHCATAVSDHSLMFDKSLSIVRRAMTAIAQEKGKGCSGAKI